MTSVIHFIVSETEGRQKDFWIEPNIGKDVLDS